MKEYQISKQWLCIENWVYAVVQPKQLLLYNTRIGQFIESKEKQHIDIVVRMHEKKNLGVVLLEEEWKNDISVLQFIKEAIDKNIFSLEDYQEDKLKPIRLMPVLNIQKDVERWKKEPDRSAGESSLQYLTELSLYVNNACTLNCNHCNFSCKQFMCCRKEINSSVLDSNVLFKIASQIKYASLSKLNILGGDIFSYSFLEQIPEIFNDKKDKIHCWSHYKNFCANDLPVMWDIIIDFPVDEQTLLNCIFEKEKEVSQYRYHFIVQNEEEVNLVEKMTEKLNIQNVEIHPYYNGENIDFFKNCIFLNREDILGNTVSQRQIFCNQALNSNFFGSLTILPNSDVTANMNTPILGNISTSSLLELITKELEPNTAWRKIRNEKPCTECLYQYVCPPVSNYEMVFEKPNLCTVQ
jgi:pseudo-rSAM protein